LILTKKTFLTSVALGIGAVINIGLNFLLIPRFQMMGAAIATLVSYFVAVVILYRFSQRHYPINYRLSKIAGLTALSIITMSAATVFRFKDSIAVDSLFRSLLMIAFLIFVGRFFLLQPRKS
jgi:O-antigen/teichoic acid export membrane protein